MGITIHYRGKIKDMGLLPSLIDDCQDFAQTMDWKYQRIEDKKFKGIILNIHPECEDFHLTFDEDGKLTYVFDHYDSYLFVKTQFSGVKTHITIIKLLKFLKSRYIPDLEVKDEGEYWHSKDPNKLSQKMSFLQSKINQVEATIKNVEFTEEQRRDVLKLAERIEEVLRGLGG